MKTNAAALLLLLSLGALAQNKTDNLATPYYCVAQSREPRWVDPSYKQPKETVSLAKRTCLIQYNFLLQSVCGSRYTIDEDVPECKEIPPDYEKIAAAHKICESGSHPSYCDKLMPLPVKAKSAAAAKTKTKPTPKPATTIAAK